jgi:hypothetical protein
MVIGRILYATNLTGNIEVFFFSIQLAFGLDALNYVYVGLACAGIGF